METSSTIAVDTGGTFTDLVVYDRDQGRFISTKSLTTYGALVQGVTDCIQKAGVDVAAAQSFKFGTTLVINTLIQRDGARTALVATKGFRDVLELRRGNRTTPYDLRYRRHDALAPRDLRFGVTERTAANGEVLTPLDLADLERVVEQIKAEDPPVEAVAVAFLNAYQNDGNERLAVDFLRERLPGVYVTFASEISREWYEYERTSTAVANAYVGPAMIDYMQQLEGWLRSKRYERSFFLMASNGGVYSVARSQREPVMLVESGPVGGCIGAAAYADMLGLDNVIALDIGGTTAKCAAIQDGRFEVVGSYYVGGTDYGFPIQGSVLDIVEVGAGGGSIAAVDQHGRLTVGPRSAGSRPGPVCYGRGGTEPTITDANVVLGRIGADSMIGGEMSLDAAAARAAIEERIARPMGLTGDNGVDRAAQGVLDIGGLLMADALKEITTVRGLDPRDFTLFVYGGGGPLHGADLARELGIRHVIVPLHPGTFSAVGMLMANARIDEQATFFGDLNAEQVTRMRERFAQMEAGAANSVHAEFGDRAFTCKWEVDLKYKSQAHTLRIPIAPEASSEDIAAAFNETYRRRYGHANLESPIVFVGLVMVVTAQMDNPVIAPLTHKPSGEPTVRRRSVYFHGVGRIDTAIYTRDELAPGARINGPAIVEDYGSSTIVGVSDRLEVGKFGELHVHLAS